MVVHSHGSVQRPVRGVANLTEYEQHLLVDLVLLASALPWMYTQRTHEPSETERTRGARSEEGLAESWELLEVDMPYGMLVFDYLCGCSSLRSDCSAW